MGITTYYLLIIIVQHSFCANAHFYSYAENVDNSLEALNKYVSTALQRSKNKAEAISITEKAVVQANEAKEQKKVDKTNDKIRALNSRIYAPSSQRNNMSDSRFLVTDTDTSSQKKNESDSRFLVIDTGDTDTAVGITEILLFVGSSGVIILR